MNFNYKSSNFIREPKPNDKVLSFLDKDYKPTYNVNPNTLTFYKQGRSILLNENNNTNIILDFIDENDTNIAMSKLNNYKKYFVNKKIDESKYFYTKYELDNGILDNRYLLKNDYSGNTYVSGNTNNFILNEFNLTGATGLTLLNIDKNIDNFIKGKILFVSVLTPDSFVYEFDIIWNINSNLNINLLNNVGIVPNNLSFYLTELNDNLSLKLDLNDSNFWFVRIIQNEKF